MQGNTTRRPRKWAGSLLAALATVSAAAAAAPEVLREAGPRVAIIDISGSMSGGFDWLAELMRSAAVAGGSTGAPQRFALVTFLDTPRLQMLGERQTSTAAALAEAVEGLATSGGTEDGYRALQFAMKQFPAQSSSLMLVTNEDRDALDESLDFDRLAAELAANHAVLDVLVNVRFGCDDGREAAGMAADGSGWTISRSGELGRCAGVKPLATLPAGQSTVRDYVDLALGSGGSAWNLYAARSIQRTREAFIAAFGGYLAERAASASHPLIAAATATPSTVAVGELVTLDGSASRHTDPQRQVYAWEWDVDGDGVFESSGPVVAAVFDEPGRHQVTLRVSDGRYAEVVVETRIAVDVVAR